MKKVITIITVAVLLVFSAVSCSSLKEMMSKNITIQESTHPIVLHKTGYFTKASGDRHILADETLNINVNKVIEDSGLDLEHLLNLNVTKCYITAAEGLDLSILEGAAVAFENAENIVAEVTSATPSRVDFKIPNPEVLEYLKNDSVRVIILGEQLPTEDMYVNLVLGFAAKVSLFK